MFLSIPAIAILKVIFGRVEDLKLWGILLGDETGIKKSRIYTKLERMKFKNIPEKNYCSVKSKRMIKVLPAPGTLST